MQRNKTFYVVGKLQDGLFEETYVNPVREKILDYGLDLDEENPSIVFSVGGDGTILRSSRKYPDSEMFGVRAESRGAWMETDFRDFEKSLEKYMNGEYGITELPKVEMEYKDKKVSGVNEVYFFRDVAKFPGANRYRVYKENMDQYIDIVYADGCSFVTPSGSSAYNWSYHGPLIDEGFLLTPMAGCLLRSTQVVDGKEVAKHAEPIRFKEDEEAFIKIKREVPNIFCGDNDIVYKDLVLEENDIIKFRKSLSSVKLVKLKNDLNND